MRSEHQSNMYWIRLMILLALVGSSFFSSMGLPGSGSNSKSMLLGFSIVNGGTVEAAPLLANDTVLLWSKRIVPYVIDSSIDDQDQVNAILEAMSWWAGGKLNFVSYDKTKHFNYVLFTRGSDSFFSETDWIGHKSAPGPTTIYLSSIADKGNIAHEIGHVLGLMHEFQRHKVDRDKYVSVFWGNIQDGKQNNFTKVGTYWTDDCSSGPSTCITGTPKNGWDYGSKFDFDSIMMYDSHDFGKVEIYMVGRKWYCFTGALLGQAWILGVDSCTDWKSYAETAYAQINSDGSTSEINANRSNLSTDDIANIQSLYSQHAYNCGTMSSKSEKPISAKTFTDIQSNFDSCTQQDYVHTETDYASLEVTATVSKPSPLSKGDFALEISTPDTTGSGNQILEGSYIGSGYDSISYKTTTPLAPGKQTISFSDLIPNLMDYSLSFAFSPVSVPKDTYDAAGKGNSASDAADLGTLGTSVFTSGIPVSDATIHTPTDIDYYQVSLPAPSSLENLCGVTGATGPNGQPIIDGKLSIKVTRLDDYRSLRTVLYRYNKIRGGPDTDPLHSRPWGWNKLGLELKCPYKYFRRSFNQLRPAIFSIEECTGGATNGVCPKKMRHYYDFTVSFTPTAELFDNLNADRILNQLEHGMKVMPAPGPTRILTENEIKWYVNQGTLMAPVLSANVGVALPEVEMIKNWARDGIVVQPGDLGKAMKILQDYDGSEGPLSTPQQILSYISRKAAEEREADAEFIARMESGQGPVPIEVPPVPTDDAQGVSQVRIRVKDAVWAPITFSLSGERSNDVGPDAVRIGYFRRADGVIVRKAYQIIDGVARDAAGEVVDLATQIPYNEAMKELNIPR